VLEHLAGVAQVLDGLQEHDGVAGLRERLHHAAGVEQVVAHVAQPGVLVRLGVGVDAHHAVRTAREHVGPVALAAGHVDDGLARDAPFYPLVDHQMAAKPVVLLGHVGQRALAREGQRRHARGLVALEVEGLGHSRAP
jgi:hypothetical protein